MIDVSVLSRSHDGFQRVREIGFQISQILEPHGKPHDVAPRERPDQRCDVAQADRDRWQFQSIEEAAHGHVIASQLEGEHAAEALMHELAGDLVVRVRDQSRIVHG